MPSSCTHRWRIATPHGPYVWGRCRRCKVVRRFPASMEGSFTFGQASSMATAQRRASRG